MRSLIKVLAITIVTLVVASQFFPDIVQIPSRWRPRLPRVEFVRHADVTPPPAPAVAAMVAPPPPPDTVAAQLPPVAAAPSLDAAKAARQEKRAHKATRRAKPKAPEIPEEDGWYATEPTAMIVPVRVTTEIELSDTTRIPTPPSPEVQPGEAWPLVCGEVVDSSGAPIEGAEVRIESNDATERTDPKGRFCLPSPTRRVTLIVTSEGRESVRYAAELEGRTTQVRIALTPAH